MVNRPRPARAVNLEADAVQTCRVLGRPDGLFDGGFRAGDCRAVAFPASTFGLGLGAFGSNEPIDRKDMPTRGVITVPIVQETHFMPAAHWEQFDFPVQMKRWGRYAVRITYQLKSASLRVQRPEGRSEIVAEIAEGTGGGRDGPADQHVVPAVAAELRHDGPRGCPQAPLGAVARHGVADLLRAGEADPDPLRGLLRAAEPTLDGQPGPRLPARPRRGEEVGAAKERADRRRTAGQPAQADSRLRPSRRRRLRITRPALVAIRARKPWRRLRTRLLG